MSWKQFSLTIMPACTNLICNCNTFYSGKTNRSSTTMYKEYMSEIKLKKTISNSNFTRRVFEHVRYKWILRSINYFKQWLHAFCIERVAYTCIIM